MQGKDITDSLIKEYAQTGVVKIPNVITPEEAAHFRSEAMEILDTLPIPDSASDYRRPFHQRVNVWRESENLKELTLHPNVAAVAERLAGTSLRLWHDHILAKMPGLDIPTAFHQDLVKWPYDRGSNALSAWIALQDTPIEMGCMGFLTGTHELQHLNNLGTNDQKGWIQEMPDLAYRQRITIPLQAGDCTFHHGLTFHTAGANTTDRWRVAHVIIYMDAEAAFTGGSHVVTNPYDIEPGSLPPEALCPSVSSMGEFRTRS